MTNARERLGKVEVKIKKLKKQLKTAEAEKAKLLKEIYGSDHNVIDAMPARVRNTLMLIGVCTDLEYQHFLNGELKKEDIKTSGAAIFHFDFYEKANTRQRRLTCFRGVGEGLAAESVRIANEKGL